MRTPLLLGALLALVAVPAQAQTGFMPYAGYNFGADEAEDGQAVIGVGFRLGTFMTAPVALAFQPQVEVGLEDDTAIQLDANVTAGLPFGEAIAPYVGAGLATIFYTEESVGRDDVDFGPNFIGGLTFNPIGFVQPFVQARYTLAGQDAFSLQGGVVFGF